MKTPKELISTPSYQEGKNLYGIISRPEYAKDIAVIFIAWFERFWYEQKWRLLNEELIKNGVATLQFDFTGLGISEWIYNQPTLENCMSDLESMIKKFSAQTGISQISLIGHSLWSCIAVVANNSQELNIDKLVLISPALNQKDLNRYWFTLSTNKDIKINYDNYKEYFDEEKYQESLQLHQTKKANIIHPDYGIQMSKKDFNDLIEDDTDILVIQGDKDSTVPLTSNSHTFSNTLTLAGGDHDLEKPEIVHQRISSAVNFVLQ